MNFRPRGSGQTLCQMRAMHLTPRDTWRSAVDLLLVALVVVVVVVHGYNPQSCKGTSVGKTIQISAVRLTELRQLHWHGKCHQYQHQSEVS